MYSERITIRLSTFLWPINEKRSENIVYHKKEISTAIKNNNKKVIFKLESQFDKIFHLDNEHSKFHANNKMP